MKANDSEVATTISCKIFATKSGCNLVFPPFKDDSKCPDRCSSLALRSGGKYSVCSVAYSSVLFLAKRKCCARMNEVVSLRLLWIHLGKDKRILTKMMCLAMAANLQEFAHELVAPNLVRQRDRHL